ncbi:uncharacterized protein LACBIDRAFT_297982 [Laccaria bicolor S238N-H82]|uniref:Predicted protein n=1 Tax=Laccaria bicolor (strain S238N-H82 / ATCC MYA-4686) TaxID=486041 RepID=B0DBZ7_LACBS|nr:uncharacterized protein LACBIDRAFT_297982 [Laccaria bicolor S238N-H82]EDR07806.1 predicted protein [Laccaria bicolor S238N-H82]|eukprot:XP_001881595.1 predicted protein [Laccaria bicolor S238N-H82]
MVREIESLNKQLQQSKSESRYLKEGVLPDLHRENKRLVEENKKLSGQLNALKGRPFEDGKALSRSAVLEQAPMIPHTIRSNSAYCGIRRKLVMAIDVGTTFSCVSYSILDPGVVPVIQSVTRYPGHQSSSGGLKIPSVLYYDQEGKVRAVGAEALLEDIYERAEDGMWTKCEWFKLHFRPQTHPMELPPLPWNNSVVEVFADYFKYLFTCASQYIRDTHANGRELWLSVKDEIDFVLPHPNGWDVTQQTQMTKAAIMAGIIPDTPSGRARVSFVTEGEASLHFSMQNGLPTDALPEGDGVVIVDAGGGTIDFSTFSRSANHDTFEEIAAPQCHFHGSVFVTMHARSFLNEHLADSNFIDDLDHIVRCFDKSTKLRFRDSAEKQYVKFGSTRDSDPRLGIRFGQLLIPGSTVSKFFEPSIDCIINAILDVRKSANRNITHVVLVGGFSASDWLFDQVRKSPRLSDLHVIRPDSHVNKAVSDGAISFYLDRTVRTRISKFTYGMFCHIPYDPTIPDHLKRALDAFMSISGSKRIGDAFDIILPRDTQVMENKEFRQSYFRESQTRNDFKDVTISVWRYQGPSSEPPMWRDVNTDKFVKIWTIKLDLSDINPFPLSRSHGEQESCYRIDYDLVFLFGWTNLKVQLAWKENGIEERSATTIIYEDA